MAQYETRAVTLGDVTMTVSKAKTGSAGDRIEAILKWLAEKLENIPRPDQGLPGGQGGRPDQGLPPSGARPDQGLPGEQPGPDQGLPGSQPRPDQGLPGSQPGPDQGLPPSGARPDQGLPGEQPKPDQGLPGSQPRPDQGLPGAQPGPDQTLPLDQLATFLKSHAKEIAGAILKDTACDPAQPKK